MLPKEVFPQRLQGLRAPGRPELGGRSIVPLVLLGGFYFPSLALLRSRAGLGFHDQQRSRGGTTATLTCRGPDTDFAEGRQPVPPPADHHRAANAPGQGQSPPGGCRSPGPGEHVCYHPACSPCCSLNKCYFKNEPERLPTHPFSSS